MVVLKNYRQEQRNMSRPYERTRIWQQAFGNLDSPSLVSLASQYAITWDRASSIAERIQNDATGLTLHDNRHFAALWEAVDMLVGDEISLNPVEVFILGVAILVHDAAHTTIAFEGGLDALSKTPEWADNLASVLKDDQPNLPAVTEIEESIKRAVVFATVRALHAKRAEKFVEMAFKHPSFGIDMFLIDDVTIRVHMGRLIGQVAASHHWDLARVAQLPKSSNVVSPYHSFGPVRPIVLASLMRTADAIQIDGHRASDFDFALTAPAGLSHHHWTAQNRLAKGVDPDDPQALLINSTTDFTPSDAPAWWVAFELATTADRELQTTNALLRDVGMPRLRLARVRDAGEPARFAKHVTTSGWDPILADVKVGDTTSLINLLGGKGLYGDDVMVPLRELLQNSIDAVRSRRVLDPDHEGNIWVELRKGENPAGNDGYWLSVADDGIGMSPAILVGPFITFGESGWSSSKLRAERPGFVGKRVSHIGRFGIGFFSVFMFSEDVCVTSRPFDAAVSSSKLLRFQSGLGLRPLLQDAPDSTARIVTKVSIFLRQSEVDRILSARDETTIIHVGMPSTKQPAVSFNMAELLGVICPTIDIKLTGFDEISGENGTVGPDWQSENSVAWLRRITGGIEDMPEIIAANADLIQEIGPEAKPTGRAALNPAPNELGVYTVGGLANKRVAGIGRQRYFVGTIDRLPSGPKRDPIHENSSELAEWATEQVRAWKKVDLTPAERNNIAIAACHFDGDPGPLANARIDQNWMDIAEIYDLLERGITLVAPLTHIGRNDDYWGIMGQVNLQSGFLYLPDEVVVERQNVLTSAGDSRIEKYWTVPEEGWPDPYTFVGTLMRYAHWKGRSLVTEGEDLDFGYYDGPTVRRRFMINGSRIVLPALKISLAAPHIKPQARPD